MRRQWSHLADMFGKAVTATAAAITVRGARALVPGTNPTTTPVQHGLYRGNVIKARASINVAGGTPTLVGSFNVAGIVDDNVGLLTVTWDRDFTDTTYTVIAIARFTIAAARDVQLVAKLAGSVQIRCIDTAAGGIDPDGWEVIAIGDQ